MSVGVLQVELDFFFFFETGSPCSHSWPGTHYVDQAGLSLGESLAFAPQVLGLKACATIQSTKLDIFKERLTLC